MPRFFVFYFFYSTTERSGLLLSLRHYPPWSWWETVVTVVPVSVPSAFAFLSMGLISIFIKHFTTTAKRFF